MTPLDGLEFADIQTAALLLVVTPVLALGGLRIGGAIVKRTIRMFAGLVGKA